MDDQFLVQDERERFVMHIVSPEQFKVHVENAGGGTILDLTFDR